MKHLFLGILVVTIIVTLTACGAGRGREAGYKQMSTSDAVALMESEDDYIILDVRTAEEFAQGRIPEAVNIPVETIGNEEITALPDKGQLILIYCRSGNRSKTAAAKLAGNGYTNIVEFGGINSWTGEVVKE